MHLLIFAMLGGSMGWGLSRMMCIADGRLALTTNILTGISGAVIAGWFLIPLMGGAARNDFTVMGPVVSLGAVTMATAAVFLRQRHRR
jgi:uncharacterized membrane protein YeaQ/YmgE (transglycosylase-associated protein family)